MSDLKSLGTILDDTNAHGWQAAYLSPGAMGCVGHGDAAFVGVPYGRAVLARASHFNVATPA